MDLATISKAIFAFIDYYGLKGEPIICAGGALWLLGLREDINDIDLLLPTMGEHHLESSHFGVDVEAYNEWELTPGLTQRVMDNAITYRGFKVMGIAELLETYLALNRPKDQTTIKLLESIQPPLLEAHNENKV